MARAYETSVGLEIAMNVHRDISDATTRKIEWKKPSGATGEWTAVADGTEGISYTTIAGDLNETGTWILQAHVVGPTYDLYGEPTRLRVEPIIA